MTAAELGRVFQEGADDGTKRAALSALLTGRAAPAAMRKAHGMARGESMRKATVQFETGTLDVYAVDLSPSSPVVTTLLQFDPKTLPRPLMAHTRSLTFASGPNGEDAHWEKEYGITGFVSHATGGDGEIVVYSGRALSRELLAHEMAHNLAAAKYGKTSPTVTSAYARAAKGDGLHPRPYGQMALAEDFAESVALYVTDRNRLRTGSPRRYNVIRRLLTNAAENG